MAEQSKVPEKFNATVRRHLTLVYGLGTDGLLAASSDPFASPGDRVFVQLEEVERGMMMGGGKEVMPIVYKADGQRQAFAPGITQGYIDMDGGVAPKLGESPAVPATVPKSFDIGQAIKEMMTGNRVRRSGWNGKGMWLKLQVPDANSKMSLPYVYMCTAQGDLVPWLCSQTDLLATDWELAE